MREQWHRRHPHHPRQATRRHRHQPRPALPERRSPPPADVMTKMPLATAPLGPRWNRPSPSSTNAKSKSCSRRRGPEPEGLVTMKDINKTRRVSRTRPRTTGGRLRVGAAISVNDFNRAQLLVDADVDVLVVDHPRTATRRTSSKRSASSRSAASPSRSSQATSRRPKRRRI